MTSPSSEKSLPLTPMDAALSLMLPVRESPDEEVESSIIPQWELILAFPVNVRVLESVGSSTYMQAGPETAPLTARVPTFKDL